MIEKIVRGSLQERLIVLVFAMALLVAGFFGVKKLSVDAFPDVTNIPSTNRNACPWEVA